MSSSFPCSIGRGAAPEPDEQAPAHQHTQQCFLCRAHGSGRPRGQGNSCGPVLSAGAAAQQLCRLMQERLLKDMRDTAASFGIPGAWYSELNVKLRTPIKKWIWSHPHWPRQEFTRNEMRKNIVVSAGQGQRVHAGVDSVPRNQTCVLSVAAVLRQRPQRQCWRRLGRGGGGGGRPAGGPGQGFTHQAVERHQVSPASPTILEVLCSVVDMVGRAAGCCPTFGRCMICSRPPKPRRASSSTS